MDASVEKVIVAVHGIGDQTRFATLQQTLSQFCRYHGEEAGVPLGNFHTEGGTSLVLPPRYPPELRRFAFAEVYWADIARDVVEKRYSLEDIQPWVRTIVSRVRQGDLACRRLSAGDQLMIEQVLGEMLQTINVLERLCFLADKLGIFSFDLKKVLVDYIDDVQIVADFKAEGKKIGKAFEERMEGVHGEYPNAKIYLVAHSEGTVVSLLGLLSALCGPATSGWIKNVRGFMTFGSPIDKHLILWPELFEAYTPPCVQGPAKPIEWRNYYDCGDPVGFNLNTAREKFEEPEWTGVFNFSADHDHGFARYSMPGKAHVDYWQDPDVFGHFIREVVYKEEKIDPKPKGKNYEKPPANKKLSQVISWGTPYMGALVLLFCAVLFLYNAAAGAVRPPNGQHGDITASFIQIPKEDGIGKTFGMVAAITCLIAGLTVGARIPRLTGLKWWHMCGYCIFLASIVADRFFFCRFADGKNFNACFVGETLHAVRNFEFSIVFIAIGVFLITLFFRWWRPKGETKAFIWSGGLGTVYALYHHFKTQPDAGSSFEFHQLWPVFVAAAVFLYLWWLVALLFDLTFVWHWYIRRWDKGKYLRMPSSTRSAPQAAAPLSAPVAAGL